MTSTQPYWIAGGISLLATVFLFFEFMYTLLVWSRSNAHERRRRIVLLLRGSWQRGWIVELNQNRVALLRSPETPDQFWTYYRIQALTEEANHIQFWHEHME